MVNNIVKTFQPAYWWEQRLSRLLLMFSSLFAISTILPSTGLAANSLTQFGITWTFDKELSTDGAGDTYQYGNFVNGDFWVVENTPDGGVTIVNIDPASTNISGRIKHGSQINPAPYYKQGYDSHYYKNAPRYYNPTLNVARPDGNDLSASNPLVVPAGSSLISAISRSEPLVRPQLQTAAILTVLSEVPPEGSFRPAYCGYEKSIKFNKADLDYSVLASLPPVAGTPQLTTVEAYFARPWLDHVKPEEVSRYQHPSSNMPNYGRDMAKQIGIGALMLQLDFTDAKKETLLIRMVQLGIDFYGVVQNDNGDIWTCAGGHSSGRKWPILFAGVMLDDADMKNIGEHAGDYSHEDYIHFGEDDQTFYVTQIDVDRHHDLNYRGQLYSDYSYPYKTDYKPEHLGMPEWGIDHGDLRGRNNGPRRDSVQWNINYRWNQNGAAWPGFILATHIMEETASAKTLWNHDALFDYQDRFMAMQKTMGYDCGDYRISWSCFVETMWDTYRADYSPVWPSDPNNPTPALQEIGGKCLGFGVTCPAARNSSYFYVAGVDRRLRAFRAEDNVKVFEAAAENESVITSIIADDNFVVFATLWYNNTYEIGIFMKSADNRSLSCSAVVFN